MVKDGGQLVNDGSLVDLVEDPTVASPSRMSNRLERILDSGLGFSIVRAAYGLSKSLARGSGRPEGSSAERSAEISPLLGMYEAINLARQIAS